MRRFLDQKTLPLPSINKKTRKQIKTGIELPDNSSRLDSRFSRALLYLKTIFMIQEHARSGCAFLPLVFPVIRIQCRRIHFREHELPDPSAGL